MYRQTNMKDLLVQLDDLPDEILMYIFKKLYNDQVLYSLMDVNQRLNRIVHDTNFIRHLCLLEYCPIHDSTSPLPDSITDRFCSKILPEIGHQIKTLFLSRTSIERVLRATNYPNLNNLGLCDAHPEAAKSLLLDENSLIHRFKNHISSLFISFDKGDNFCPIGLICSSIFEEILILFTNLQCLIFNPSATLYNAVTFLYSDSFGVCSTLLELHISVTKMEECLYILDEIFDQLRILHVTFHNIPSQSHHIEHKKKLLTNLRIFSLCCKQEIYDFNGLIAPLLRRMLNLEELDLNIKLMSYTEFIDIDILKNDIIIYMPRLQKFTFNIYSIIDHRHQAIFPLNEHMEKTFQYFSNNQITTRIDHFEKGRFSQCHVYSSSYKMKIYNNITNNFRGGIFTSVTEVSLRDEYPFEHEFFLRIAQSFPSMKQLTIKNRQAQNNKQLIKSNNDYQILSIIEYPNLTRLDLNNAHDDYVELFLFDTKMSVPNNLHLCVDYQSLKRVTYYFTRYITRNNYVKLAALYCDPNQENDEHFKKYFTNTRIYNTFDFIIL
ncbi:unnamed protein product [Adineta steineri]|uniref:F-box domain-containing protein n=1 Tax=Adineta steineri TaxID=433720 RepID=A0A814JNV6_9BILA|nr:unnamed protein product [Adineta steineri]CAF0825531.1 unnamed protein product [Adineta steineri]CAF1040559.1 unnamed protein product [Adineta steineri]